MTVTQPAPAERRPGPDMVWVPGGTFLMGSDHHYPEEAPAHPVTVDGFWIDRHTVTNAEFAAPPTSGSAASCGAETGSRGERD